MSAPAFCTECGSPLTPGAGFCTTCGTAITPSPPPASPVAQSAPAVAAAPALPAVSTGLGLAAKLGLAALVVGVAAGGTWVVTSQNTRANSATQTSQSAPGNPTQPISQPGFIVSGPDAVPYGEHAVFTVTLDNTTALPVRVWNVHQTNLSWETSWSPNDRGVSSSGSMETVEPGASFTWTVTIRTRFVIMDQYTLFFHLFADYPDGPDEWEFTEDVAHMLTIASPDRSLDPYWDDWCDLMKNWYATQELSREMHAAKIDCLSEGADSLDDDFVGDPTCEYTLSQEYADEENLIHLRFEALDAERFSYMDDDGLDNRFTRLSDQYACSCWCRYSEAIICNTIPWGTDAELPEATGPPGTIPTR